MPGSAGRRSVFIACAFLLGCAGNATEAAVGDVAGQVHRAAAPSGDPVLVGAGDIADCTTGNDDSTAVLIDQFDAVVFTLGDNAYPEATADDFANCYGPTWGRNKYRTYPTPGNHEYEVLPDASAYFSYFGDRAGAVGKGYYSYDVGSWHIIAINSALPKADLAAQLSWLASDLAAHKGTCTLAYFHYPLFSSGIYAIPAMKPIWQVLYNGGVSVVLNGHDHHYERFAPQTPDGVADPVHGIREFIVGTGGGRGLHPLPYIAANSEVRTNTVYGVLKLTLHLSSYTWEFIPTKSDVFADAGTESCHQS